MAILRFIAGLLLLIAVIALVYDGTRTASGSGISMTSVGEHWTRLAPGTLKGAQSAVQRYSHPLVWDAVIASLLRLPAWILLGAIGGLFALAGRRRRRVNVYAN